MVHVDLNDESIGSHLCMKNMARGVLALCEINESTVHFELRMMKFSLNVLLSHSFV